MNRRLVKSKMNRLDEQVRWTHRLRTACIEMYRAGTLKVSNRIYGERNKGRGDKGRTIRAHTHNVYHNILQQL